MAAGAGISKSDLVAIDCEMIGNKVIKGLSYLAHVGIVDASGNVLLNIYVQKPDKVKYKNINYRTEFSGITPHILERATDTFSSVQREVERILEGKIVVGHALENDFRALRIDMSKYRIIDTAHTPVFMQLNPRGDNLQPRNLKKLAEDLLKKSIQTGTHDALEDARTAMELVLKYETDIDVPAEKVIERLKAQRKKLANNAAKLATTGGRRYTRHHKYYRNKTRKTTR